MSMGNKKKARINDGCINCGACKSVCPMGAIFEKGECWVDKNGIEHRDLNKHCVNTERCVGCGMCCKVCPIENIELAEE